VTYRLRVCLFELLQACLYVDKKDKYFRTLQRSLLQETKGGPKNSRLVTVSARNDAHLPLQLLVAFTQFMQII